MKKILFLFFINFFNLCLPMKLNPAQIDEFEQALNSAAKCINLWKGSIWTACIYHYKMSEDKFDIKSNLFTILNSHEYDMEKSIKDAELLKAKFEKISQSKKIFIVRKFLENHIEKLNLQLLNESFRGMVNWMHNPDSKLDYLGKLNLEFTVHYTMNRAMFAEDISIRKQACFDLIKIFSENKIEHPEKTQVINFLKKMISE